MDSEFNKTADTIRRIVKECPWGKDQTLKEHIKELRSELEELKGAFDNKDLEEIKSELGDVFYDSLFLLILAEKEHDVDIEEVIKRVREKVERRKPYIFGDMKPDSKNLSKEEALKIWNDVKKKEGN